MEYIKNWLKTILYMNILLLICDNLMQKTAYEKYYRFFSGFLLVLCLGKPVMDLVGAQQYFQTSFLQEQWNMERNLLKNSKEIEKMKEAVTKEQERAYKNQIRELAVSYGIKIKDVAFAWNRAEEKLKRIKIRGTLQDGNKKNAGKADTDEIQKLKKVLMQLYELDESDICIDVEVE